MSKEVIAVVAVIAIVALAFGIFSFIRADRIGKQATVGVLNRGVFEFGPGMMGRQGSNFGSGMMGGRNGKVAGQGYGVMQQYEIAALAEKLGMTTDDLTKQLNSGKTVLDLAADKGMTVKDFITMQEDVRVSAIDKALAAGVISQNQADAMKANKTDGRMGGFGSAW
jgi:hypothetical protein